MAVVKPSNSQFSRCTPYEHPLAVPSRLPPDPDSFRSVMFTSPALSQANKATSSLVPVVRNTALPVPNQDVPVYPRITFEVETYDVFRRPPYWSIWVELHVNVPLTSTSRLVLVVRTSWLFQAVTGEAYARSGRRPSLASLPVSASANTIFAHVNVPTPPP